MPYINNAAKRYSPPVPFVENQNTNRSADKMGSKFVHAAREVKRNSVSQHPSSTPLRYEPPTAPRALRHGFGGERAAFQQDSHPQFGYSGFVGAEQANTWHGWNGSTGYYAEEKEEGEIERQGPSEEQGIYRYSSNYDSGHNYPYDHGYGYSTEHAAEPAATYGFQGQVYYTPPTQTARAPGQEYNGQLQYQYAYPLDYSWPYAQYQRYGYPYQPAQPPLTPHWQAVNNAQPPLPHNWQPIKAPQRPQALPNSSYNSGNGYPLSGLPQQPLKSVTAADLDRRFRVNKESRYGANGKQTHNAYYQPRDQVAVNHAHQKGHIFQQSPDTLFMLGKSQNYEPNPAGRVLRSQAQEFAGPFQELPNSPSLPNDRRTSQKPKKKHLQMLEKPIPSAAYVAQANRDPRPLDGGHGRPLLIVLDLNGTLLHRKSSGTTFVSRPHVDRFLGYLLANHHVMIWSSAKPWNVNGMCAQLFTKAQLDQLVAVWGRDTLRLPAKAYNQKVQVYKQLSWIWQDALISPKNCDLKDLWDQSNTVLIDDSVEKAASEPHNIIQIAEFEGLPEQMKVDVLGQVVKYLEKLRKQEDVSAFMRASPFVFEAEEESFEWASVPYNLN